ncbi:hypothetical protein ABIB62_001947 [Mucilaginibacter sp. UYP25]|uniref:hypothetical protein n=1 Tax=unclassified Mucilaginibacter TaxID=2617802 RepID=UPI003391DE1E
MKRSIFYFEKFRPWDIWTIVIYATISFYVFFNLDKNILSFYANVTCLFIYLFNYKSLRNLSVYLVWLIFGIYQFCAYLYLRNDDSLIMKQGGNAASGLRNVIISIVLFQVLRILSLNIQNQELVAPTRGGVTDVFGERPLTSVDYVFFLIYMGCFLGLIFLRG